MTKRIAYWALHYGADFLAWSIRSVQDAVDELHFLYTDRPSHEHQTKAACPETEAQLRKEAERFAKKPIFWHQGHWPNEGAQRDSIFPIARERGADIVLWVDADELWCLPTLHLALNEAEARKEFMFRYHFLHFWRSFKWVCRDPAWPSRVFNVRNMPPSGTPWPEGYLAHPKRPVYHFGYVLPEGIMRYKWTIHGHLSELRPGWMEEKYLGWKPGDKDVHPTCRDGYWNPEPVDEETRQRVFPQLSDHPFFDTELVR